MRPRQARQRTIWQQNNSTIQEKTSLTTAKKHRFIKNFTIVQNTLEKKQTFLEGGKRFQKGTLKHPEREQGTHATHTVPRELTFTLASMMFSSYLIAVGTYCWPYC